MKQSIQYRRRGYLYPAAALVIGTVHEGRVNWSTIAYHGILGADRIMLCMESSHLTTKAIAANGCFSVNIPSCRHMERVDIAGTRSGHTADKSGLFACSMHSSLIPLVDEFLLSYVCRVEDTVEKDGETYIYAAVNEIFADDGIMNGGLIDIKQLHPLLFDWGGYYGVGEYCGKPFSKHTL